MSFYRSIFIKFNTIIVRYILRVIKGILPILCGLVIMLVGCSKEGVQKEHLSQLNDTGISWSGEIPKNNNTYCTPKKNDNRNEQVHRRQQDCRHGRDFYFDHAADGDKGFSYQKIHNTGRELLAGSAAWSCVYDKVSNLMWESKKQADGEVGNNGLHDADDHFTWYSSNRKNNAGRIGIWNKQGNHCFGYMRDDPKTFCHTEQFVHRVNTQGLCGYNDWRLPTRSELSSIVHFGRTEPAIENSYFPHTHNSFYWSSTPKVARIDESWALNFQFGFVSPMRRTDTHYVRLVRSHRSRQIAKKGAIVK